MTSQEPASPRSPPVVGHASTAQSKAPAAATMSAVIDLKSDPSAMSVDNISESSEDVIMKEKLLPKVKQVSKCSYCQANSAESLKTVPCLGCGSRCHIDCIECSAKFKDKILLGDDFFHFKCSKCTDGHEKFKRYHLSWVDVVHITLFNLTHNPPIRPSEAEDPTGQFSSSEHGPQEYGDSRTYFHYKADVARFIDKHWSYFWTKSRGETWINSASSALSTNSTENVPEDGRFESGKAKYNRNGMWALTDDLRFPSSYDSLQQQKTRTIMYSFAEDGSLVELRNQSANGRRKRRTEQATPKATVRAKKPRSTSASQPGSASVGYGDGNDYITSKRSGGARGKKEPKSTWSISMWPDIDNPQGPAHMSREDTHAAVQYVIESDRLTVWNDKGYRMAKASHGVETGAWYFETEIMDPVRPEFNLRIGWSQISGELQAPCGYDVFSYSMRAKPSTRFHAAIGSPYGEEYGPGDTLGVLIYMPPLDGDEKQDLADRKLHPGERYRQFTYSRPESQRPPHANSELPPLPVLAGSELVYFKNGKCLGPAFQKLYLGKYYPAVSAYMGGKVKVNLGPNFKYPPPATWHENTQIRPISDLEFTLPPPQEPKPEEGPAAAETSGSPAESKTQESLPEDQPAANNTNGNSASEPMKTLAIAGSEDANESISTDVGGVSEVAAEKDANASAVPAETMQTDVLVPLAPVAQQEPAQQEPAQQEPAQPEPAESSAAQQL